MREYDEPFDCDDVATTPTSKSRYSLALAESGKGCNHVDHEALADELLDLADRLTETALAVFGVRVAEPVVRPRSPGADRATHVEVDDEAWAHLKRNCIEQREGLGQAMGRLVRRVSSGLPITIRGRANVPSEMGRRARHFVRLAGVSDDQWAAFRVVALDACVTSARLVGLIAEEEARQLGWLSWTADNDAHDAPAAITSSADPEIGNARGRARA